MISANPILASFIVTVATAVTALIYYGPLFGKLMAARLKIMMGHKTGFLDESLDPHRMRRVFVMTFVFMYIAALAYSAVADGYGMLLGASPWQLSFGLWIFFGAAFRVITFHFKFDRLLIILHVGFWSLAVVEYAILFPLLLR